MWHFAMRKEKIGSVWFSSVIVAFPNLDLLLLCDDVKKPIVKVYELYRLSQINVNIGSNETDSAVGCTAQLKTSLGDYTIEGKTKEYVSKFVKAMDRLLHPELENSAKPKVRSAGHVPMARRISKDDTSDIDSIIKSAHQEEPITQEAKTTQSQHSQVPPILDSLPSKPDPQSEEESETSEQT